MLVEDTELSTRAKNCLRNGGFYSMEDVLKTPSWELRRIPELGDKTLREIQEWANLNGKAAFDDRMRLKILLSEMERRKAQLEKDMEAIQKRLSV